MPAHQTSIHFYETLLSLHVGIKVSGVSNEGSEVSASQNLNTET